MGRCNQPKAIRSCRSDTRGRIVGALNGVSGELTYRIASAITVKVFCDFLLTIAQKYGHFKHVYIVLDNWPQVHCHPHTLLTFKRLTLFTHLQSTVKKT